MTQQPEAHCVLCALLGMTPLHAATAMTLRVRCRVRKEAQKAAELQVGSYVRVHGKFSEFNGAWRIQAFHVRPITDFNEVQKRSLLCHQLPCRAMVAPLLAGVVFATPGC